MEAPDTTVRRVIAHVDADAFYASVHLLEDPSLEGKPVVVAGSGARSIVTTANYEARKFGIGSAQPAARARKLCPHAVFLRPNFDLYRAYSRRAMAIMEQYSATIEPLSLDEAYLDISSAEKPVRWMREMIAQILDETGLQYSVGIGPNKLCAKVLSELHKPAAFNVASREQCCEIFGDASPRIIPGIGPKSAEALAAMELTTIAALRNCNHADLAAAFGDRRASELQARARFEHEGKVESERILRSKSEERTFETDVADLDELVRRMRELSAELCQQLSGKELRGRTVGIKVRLADFTTVTRARTLPEFTNLYPVVADLAETLLRTYDPQQPVRLIGVRIANFEHELDEVEDDAPSTSYGVQLQLMDTREFLRAPLRLGPNG